MPASRSPTAKTLAHSRQPAGSRFLEERHRLHNQPFSEYGRHKVSSTFISIFGGIILIVLMLVGAARMNEVLQSETRHHPSPFA